MEKNEEELLRKRIPRLIELGMRRHEMVGMLTSLLICGQEGRREHPLMVEIYHLEQTIRANMISELLIRGAQAMLAGHWDSARAFFDRVDDIEGRLTRS